MLTPPCRVATLVLADAAGTLVGALAPIEVDTPWWMDVGPIVRAVHARDALRVTILRLLSARQDAPHGGAVTYLAQVDSTVPVGLARPWAGALPDDPLRNAYARVGGPHADLAWATTTLAAQGLVADGPAEQIRTWNLSSLWRLPTKSGRAAWLKVVPPFFAHEGKVLALLADAPVPRLLGSDGCRMLLADIDGDDLYDADPPMCLAMIDLLVELQRDRLGRTEELLRLGLPDWRGPAMTQALGTLFERRAGGLSVDDRRVLGAFVQGLPARFGAITDCGIPDGLVHGDFHPGNLRGKGGSLTLLDWGDSGIGHPLLDQPAFLSRMAASAAESARRHWAQAWQRHFPHADVERAATLLAAMASARMALNYQRFLDNIEDAERPYHQADVVAWLERASQQVRVEAPF